MKIFMIMPQKTHVNRLKRGRMGGEKVCMYVCIMILILALDQGQRLASSSCHRCTLDQRAAMSCRYRHLGKVLTSNLQTVMPNFYAWTERTALFSRTVPNTILKTAQPNACSIHTEK